MNNNVLFLERKTNPVWKGYQNAFRALGWNVFISNTGNTLFTKNKIKENNIDILFASAADHLKSIPRDIDIPLCLEASPCNHDRLSFNNEDVLEIEDIDLFSGLKNPFLFTYLEPDHWSTYLSMWLKICKINHSPLAGDLTIGCHTDMNMKYHVGSLLDFHKSDDPYKNFILPIIQRFGNKLTYNIRKYCSESELLDMYATSLFTVNLHDIDNCKNQFYINSQSFDIPLRGGDQMIDSILYKKYLGNHVRFVPDFYSLNHTLEHHLCNFSAKDRSYNIFETAKYIGSSHTYFNRLLDIFKYFQMSDHYDNCHRVYQRLYNQHIWKMECVLSASISNEKYTEEPNE